MSLRTTGLGDRSRVRDVCARWQTASLRAGWAFPQDWWVPAVEAVAEAVCEDRDLLPACAELGRARADAGVGLEEALADLTALSVVLAEGDPLVGLAEPEAPSRLVQALAVGWAAVASDPATVGICEDPLTRLATPAYLRTRLTELYREAGRQGVPAGQAHAFVVVMLQSGRDLGLVALSRSLLLGDCLRAVFSGGETLCELRSHCAVALVRREPALAGQVQALQQLLGDQVSSGLRQPARVWVEGLPGTVEHAWQLVDELGR